jgi:hypothetical protein
MKKLALVTAIAAAATLSTGAHAVISSSITGIQLISAGNDMTLPCSSTYNPGFTTGLQLAGTTPSGVGGAVTLLGQACLDPGTGIHVALSFALGGAEVATGTTFTTGSIVVFTDFGSGWMFAYNIDAAASSIDCTTASGAGLQWTPTPGTNTLGGAASPALPGTPTNGTCSANLLGNPATIFLTGTNTW